MSEKDDKKQKVIHTRVSETMDQQLKERAERLGVSVSNLVRNVLQNTFGLVESIVADTASVARSARGEVRSAPSSPGQDVVVGWQVLVLNVNAICVHCNAILAKGGEAAIAISAAGTSRSSEFICPSCLKELGDEQSPPDPAE